MMKTIHLIVFIMMLFFAFLQWNDTDRGYWVAIYLAASILALIAFIQSCSTCIITWAILLIISCVFLIMPIFDGVLTFFHSSNINEFFSEMQKDKPHVEQIREFSGLLIIIIYSIITLVISYKNINAST